MTDPISPMGSPGQLPLVVPGALSPSPAPAGEGFSTPVNTGTTQASPAQDAVQLDLSQQIDSSAKNAPKAELSFAEAAASMREYIESLPSNLQFRADKDSGYIICKVVNPVTREVIRQYPPEEIVEMARRLRALRESGAQSGALLDEEI